MMVRPLLVCLSALFAGAALAPPPVPISLTSPVVRKIAGAMVGQLDKAAAKASPASSVKLVASIVAEQAKRTAEVEQVHEVNMGGFELPAETVAAEAGTEYFVTALSSYTPRSAMQWELNPWPAWELVLSKVWTQHGRVLHFTALIVPHHAALDVSSKLVNTVAAFAMSELRRLRHEACSWASCTELAAVVSAESQTVEVAHLVKLAGSTKRRFRPESRTKVFYVSFLTMSTKDLAAPAVQHMAAVAQRGDDATRMSLIAHDARSSPGITVVKGRATLPVPLGKHRLAQLRTALAKEAGASASANDVVVRHVVPRGGGGGGGGSGAPGGVTLDWQVSVAGGAASLEADYKSARFAAKLGKQLNAPPGGGVTVSVLGDLSSSMEGNELAVKVRHSVKQKLLPVVGACGSSALMAALFSCFATSIAWLVWIKEHGGTADGSIDGGGGGGGGGGAGRGGYVGVPGRVSSAQDELEGRGGAAAGRYHSESNKDGSVEFGL